MPELLFEEDYQRLKDNGWAYSEDEEARYLFLTVPALPAGLYTSDACEVLVKIPDTYNQDGNDMFWTSPLLLRRDGVPIPNTAAAADQHNVKTRGKEWFRWSRHWPSNHQGVWRPGKDDVMTIVRRVIACLNAPNA